MADVERALAEVATAVDWPRTPELAAAVERRLAAEPAPHRRRFARPLAVALAVAVAALGALLALSPGARSAFLEIFGIEGATVVRLEELPPVEAVAREAILGRRVALDAPAVRRVPVPRGAGRPGAAYVHESGMVTLVWSSGGRPRLLLSAVRGRRSEWILKKAGGGGTTVREVDVDGADGLFLTGRPHYFAFVTADGREWGGEFALARDVLLWNDGATLYRLEGELSLEEALELARSLAPA